MIQANELRIGNWVISYYPIAQEHKEYRIKDGKAIDFAEDEEYGGYYPIELTPEILEKAGFLSAPVLDEIHWMQIFVPEHDLPGIDLPVFKIFQYKDGRIGYATKTIKYVHQLQNLYFALTGTELKIEL